MRKVFEPVIPTASCFAAIVVILAVSVPVVKFAVEVVFSAFGY